MGPNEILDKGFVIDAPVPQHHAVILTGPDNVAPVAASGNEILGFAEEGADELDVERGRHIRVRTVGVAYAVAGETFSVPDNGTKQWLQVDGEGRVIPLAAGKAVGYATSDSEAVGDWVTVFIVHVP